MSGSVIIWDGKSSGSDFVLAQEHLSLALVVEKPPGFHLCVITDSIYAHDAEIELRLAGYEIRDSLRWFYDGGNRVSEKTIILGRKPLEGTIVQNLLKHGEGIINIDGCRVGDSGARRKVGSKGKSVNCFGDGLNGGIILKLDKGKWPANILWDGSDVVKTLFPKDTSECFYDTSEQGAGIDGLVAYLNLMLVVPKFSGGEV